MPWNGFAQESEKDHGPIMEVLTTYVREHPPRKRSIKTKKTEIISAPRADIPTILTVIGRRGRTFKKGEDERLYLFRTDLVEANLTFAHLEGQAGSRRMASGPNVSAASLLCIYILLALRKKLRIVLSGDHRFFVLVRRDPILVNL